MSSIKFTMDGQPLEVDIQFKECSKLAKEILEENSADAEIPLASKDFTLEHVKEVVEYCRIYGFKLPQCPKKVTSPRLEDHVSGEGAKLLQKYTIFSIKPLMMAAYYLQVNELLAATQIYIACQFYFDNKDDGYKKVKERHGITRDLDEKDEEEILKEWPEILDSDEPSHSPSTNMEEEKAN
jgi:Skp1 family, tetramerisation domain